MNQFVLGSAVYTLNLTLISIIEPIVMGGLNKILPNGFIYNYVWNI